MISHFTVHCLHTPSSIRLLRLYPWVLRGYYQTSTTFFRKVIVKSSEEQSWFGVYILYRAQVCGVD